MISFKKLWVLSLLLFLLVHVSYAVDTKSVTLYSGDSYNFEGYNIYLLQASSSNKLLIRVDAENGFVNFPMTPEEFESNKISFDNEIYSDGPSTKVGDVKIILKQICFDLNDNNCGRINDIGKYVEPSYTLELSLFSPDLTVVTEYSKDNIWLGDEFYVTTTIKNDGDVNIKNLVYVENYPATVIITPKDGITVSNNAVKFKRSYLGAEDEVHFRYKVKLVEKLKYSLRGEYTFTHNDIKFSDFGPKVNLALKDSYAASFTVPSSMSEDDEFAAKISFKNLAEDDIDFYLDLDIPEEVLLVDPSEFLEENGHLIYSGKLDAGKTFEDALKFATTDAGDAVFDLYVHSKYLVENPTEIITKKVSVKTVAIEELDDDFEIVLKIDADTNTQGSTDILEGDKVHFEVFLTKGDFELRDIFVNVSNSDLGMTFISEKSFIEDDVYYDNFLYSLKMPLVNTTEEFEFTAYVEGRVNGTLKNVTSTNKFTLYDLDDALTLERTVPEQIAQGAVGLVSVALNNNADRVFMGIKAKDLIPEDFFYKAVVTERVLNLQPLENKILYTYEIKAPYFLDEESEVRTVLLFEDLTIVKNSSLNTFVDVKVPDLDISTDIEGGLFVGSRFLFGVSVENKGDLVLKDVSIEFPLSEGADLMLSEEELSFTELLDEDEKIYFFKTYILKKEGTFDFEGGIITYFDEFGNKFFEEIKPQSLEIDSGRNDCFLNSEKKLFEIIGSTYDSKKVPFVIEFTNFCNADMRVKLNDPLLSFNIPANSKQTVDFTEFYAGNFSGSLGNSYEYETSEFRSISVTNSVGGSFEIIEPELESESQGILPESVSNSSTVTSGLNTGGAGGSSGTPQGINSIELDGTGTLSLAKRLGGIFLAVLIVLVIMVLVMKIVKSLTSKIHKHDKLDLEPIELKIDDSQFVEAPQSSSGVDKLTSYVSSARSSGVPEIEIEKSLFNVGWTKEAIDSAMHH